MTEPKSSCSLFYLPADKTEVAVVATNGVVRADGGVMGKGQALEAKNLFPGIERKLGKYLQKYGNRVFYMGTYRNGKTELFVVTFSTKKAL